MKKLRVCLLVDNYELPAWAYKMVESIALSEFAEIILVIKKENEDHKNSLFKNVRRKFQYALFSLHSKWENYNYNILPDALFWLPLRARRWYLSGAI